MDGERSQTTEEDHNARSLNQLVRAIGLAERQFALILVCCNYRQLRDLITQQVKIRVPQSQTLTLPESAKTLYTTIQAEMANQSLPPSALMLFGLDSLTALDQALVATNIVREELRKFSFPVVLWVNDDVLRKLERLATDLYNWAGTTLIQFKLPSSELVRSLKEHSDRLFSSILDIGDEQFLANWKITPSTNALRPTELKFALEDLRASQYPIDPELQASLDFLLGQDAHAQGDMDTARDHYEHSLEYWQRAIAEQDQPLPENQDDRDSSSRPYPHPPLIHPSPLERSACVLFYLGLWWRSYAVLQRAAYQLACQKAYDHFRRSLIYFSEENRQDLVARFVIALAETLQKLERWDDLEEVARRSLVLHQLYPDPIRQARDRGFLAEVAIARCDWATAKHHVTLALQILDAAELSLHQAEPLAHPQLEQGLDLAHRYHFGWYLLLLAKAERALGNLDIAIRHLEDARDHSFPQSDPPLYIQVLQKLRDSYFESGNYQRAFRTKQVRRLIEHQYGYRAFVGALRLQPQQFQVGSPFSLPVQVDQQTLLAQEISASGRQKDVDRLIARLTLPKDKLIVIHGPSGVGKSSIVNAGLFPMLGDRLLGERTALPILIDVYTDWQTGLQKKLETALGETEAEDLPQDSPESDGKGETDVEISFDPLLPRAPAPLPPLTPASPALLALLHTATSLNLLPVLIFDQFEEFFFTCDTIQARRSLYSFLRDCLNTPFVKVILSLREDYLHYLLEFQRLADLAIIDHDILSKDIRYPLDDFTPDEAKIVIKSLANKAQFYLPDDLIEEVVRDLAGDLGEVRPIELQVVGAQLQAEGIDTLEEYRRKGPKEKLVQRSLGDVVTDCGPENESLARIILFSLTNPNGTRPLKTRDDLESDLIDLGLINDLPKLDLVLEVLVGSGLLFLIPDAPATWYQLVHDYLVSFIREQQQCGLVAELERERELRQFTEEELRQTVSHLEVDLDNERFITSSLSAEALLTVNQDLEALIQAVQIGKRLQRSPSVRPDVRTRAIAALNTVVYGVREKNRFQTHTGSVLSVSFSPDGTLLASGSLDNTVKIWTLDGQTVHTFDGHSDAVKCVSFSPDGTLLASGSFDHTVKIWSLLRTANPEEFGQELHTLESSDSSRILSVSFSPDGTILASGNFDGTVTLWSLLPQEFGEALHTLNGHSSSVNSIGFSPDGEMLISGSDDGQIKLWNLVRPASNQEFGEELQTLDAHSDAIASVSFSPDGSMFASGSDDGTVKLWTLNGRELQTFKGHNSAILTVSFSLIPAQSSELQAASLQEFGTILASGSDDSTIKLWSLDGRELQTLRGHSSGINSLSFSPVFLDEHRQRITANPELGLMIASGSDDKTVRLWSLEGRKPQVFKGHHDSVSSVSFSPDGTLLASSSFDNTVKIWSLTRLESDSAVGQELQTLSGHSSWVRSVSFNPDGTMLASSSFDNTVKIWSLIRDRDSQVIGRERATLKGHRGWVRSVSFSPDGTMLVSGSRDKTVKLWSVDGQELKTFKGHNGWVWSVCFSPDGTLLASGSDDNTIKLWSLDGKELQTLTGHSDSVSSVSFSPDGTLLASGSDDNTVKLWSLVRDGRSKMLGREVQTLKGHTSWVSSVSFSPDGTVLASSGGDSTVKLWSLDGRLLQTLKRHSSWVSSVSFSPDGKTLASSSGDNTIILWNFDLEDLLAKGCRWLHAYFQHNPTVREADRHLCDLE